MKTFFGFVLLALGLLLLFWFLPPPSPTEPVPPAEWLVYENERYDFRLSYPSDWRVWEGEVVGTPAISVVPAATASSSLPLTHHSNATQVSVFPEGIPTEGVFGEAATSSLDLVPTLVQAIDFRLASGEVWGTYLNFASPPVAWEPWGFVWGAAAVNNLEAHCLGAAGEALAPEACGLPFAPGARVVRFGQLNEAERATVARILESFSFLNS